MFVCVGGRAGGLFCCGVLQDEKPHLVPKWLRGDRRTVVPQVAVESDECNLVCPVCNKYEGDECTACRCWLEVMYRARLLRVE